MVRRELDYEALSANLARHELIEARTHWRSHFEAETFGADMLVTFGAGILIEAKTLGAGMLVTFGADIRGEDLLRRDIWRGIISKRLTDFTWSRTD